jgi:uncharacterized peroxidase-related enzyme
METQIRVPVVPEAEATGRVKELYDQTMEQMGVPFVPDIVLIFSSRPEYLDIAVNAVTTLFTKSKLPPEVRELIITWTSKLNECGYCVGAHSFFLRLFGGSDELVAAAQNAARVDDLPVDGKTRELLRLTTQVAQTAYRITDGDWQRCYDAGWTREQVMDAVFAASLYSFVVRFVSSCGLGPDAFAGMFAEAES